ncbi:hypothetical protein D3C76_336710 [compost metagenome]
MVKRAPLSTLKIVDESPAAVPSAVARAMKVDFDFEITAYLTSVEYVQGEQFIKGHVFGDREKRFDDGNRIRTSIITSFQEAQGYLVAYTLNSRYVICDWAGEGTRGASKAQH